MRLHVSEIHKTGNRIIVAIHATVETRWLIRRAETCSFLFYYDKMFL
jgi:hypothetical protein